MTDIVSFKHGPLTAYAVDPNMTEDQLRELVLSKISGDGSALDIKTIAPDMRSTGTLGSFSELGANTVEQVYQIPDHLKPFRDAFAIKLDLEGKFNGTTARVIGRFRNPMTISPGGHYDFVATKPENVPAELLGELFAIPIEQLVEGRFSHARGQEERFGPRYDAALIDRFRSDSLEEFLRSKGLSQSEAADLRGSRIGALGLDRFEELFDIEGRQIRALCEASYEDEKTLRDYMPEWGMTTEDRARYFGVAQLLKPSNGDETLFVYRGLDLDIAADIISFSGCTPLYLSDFHNPGFDFGDYYQTFITDKLGSGPRGEFALERDEMRFGKVYLLDGDSTIPHAAPEIIVPNSSVEDIAKRNVGREGAYEEHPVIFGIRTDAIKPMLNLFGRSMEPSSAYMFHLMTS
jgi:hypothetical protein